MRNRKFLFFKKPVRYLIIFITIFLLLQPISAFWYFSYKDDKVVWDSDPDHLRAGAISFPSGSSFRAALGEVINQLNTNPSQFQIDLDYDEEHVREGNSQSEIWFSSDFDLHHGHNARTWTRMIGDEIHTADIILNSNTRWASGTQKSLIVRYGGDAQSFRAILIHELGHVIPLFHESRVYNVMGETTKHIHANGNNANGYLGEDASNGAVFLYGQVHAREDLSVTHWKWASVIETSGHNGNYSDHTRTEIRQLDGRLLPAFIEEDGEVVYMVTWGMPSDITIEFTLENSGNSTHNDVQIGYYISDNEWITTHDRRIGGCSADLSRDQVWTIINYPLTIPGDLELQKHYYIGVIVDETDEIEEINEINNATYIAGIWTWGPLP